MERIKPKDGGKFSASELSLVIESIGRPEAGLISGRDIDIFILERPAPPEDIDRWREEVVRIENIRPAYARSKRQFRRLNKLPVRIVKTPVGRVINQDGEEKVSPVFHNQFMAAVRKMEGLVSIITRRIDHDKTGRETLSYMYFPAV